MWTNVAFIFVYYWTFIPAIYWLMPLQIGKLLYQWRRRLLDAKSYLLYIILNSVFDDSSPFKITYHYIAVRNVLLLAGTEKSYRSKTFTSTLKRIHLLERIDIRTPYVARRFHRRRQFHACWYSFFPQFLGGWALTSLSNSNLKTWISCYV